ncbi:toprim domain / DNA topoisomerase multi-domain protein [Lachnoanaerobaculum saburreum F0468]|jgi:DNA topoisomerase|uniref:DNA topoisomerase n=1 Tax=Lachnoanaerobaculum saburreum F0468 TaxID=1095750 RepID=I0RA38_9FIRM|nr:DNA topoisomerase [Lachnoanaerobaculum saburreum]EIC96546.1 toprim domain / DNA topoisomerase multi-domain protein [Lachnoanaerobaculum saburreum F0468]
MKKLFITEKPSVAAEFAKALKVPTGRKNGYLEGDSVIVTWCVGHLITMSYPEKYDEKFRCWSLDTLPFLPKEFKYEVIDGVKKQFETVSSLLNREDIDTIYICTDSGREGEYIYRLVDMMANVKGKVRKRVWIDSQTEEEIRRGIKEAKDWSYYDNLSAAAFLRAKEDYLMGINFSRILTLKYGRNVANFLKLDRAVLSVGRVMTCVVGMVVNREREIRNFVKTPFYKVSARCKNQGMFIDGEWKVNERSKYFNSPMLYKDNGFRERIYAQKLTEHVEEVANTNGREAIVLSSDKKKEVKNPPLLFNLAEVQNECSKRFKISPDETLKIIQELYEKKLVTYPRTDARVLSGAVAKEIDKNIKGLCKFPLLADFANDILNKGTYKNISKTKYVNDSQITDHYAIIPTGFGNINSLGRLQALIYELICRRFLAIFYPPAVYQKFAIKFGIGDEIFITNTKFCIERGFLDVVNQLKEDDEGVENQNFEYINMVSSLRKGSKLILDSLSIKEGETVPPKRYSSGSIILAMENAGQLIEDEDLRSQIKGNGIGTSATRADILKKLFAIKYLALNKKTQIITPTLFGEIVYEVVNCSISQLLNPELTASWEKGLTMVSNGDISSEEYMVKLERFVGIRCLNVKQLNNQYSLNALFEKISKEYKGMKG